MNVVINTFWVDGTNINVKTNTEIARFRHNYKMLARPNNECEASCTFTNSIF